MDKTLKGAAVATMTAMRMKALGTWIIVWDLTNQKEITTDDLDGMKKAVGNMNSYMGYVNETVENMDKSVSLPGNINIFWLCEGIRTSLISRIISLTRTFRVLLLHRVVHDIVHVYQVVVLDHEIRL